MIAVALVIAIATIGIPVYRGYVATARDGALVSRMASMSVFQEDTRLRTGAYGAGVHNAAQGVATLANAIGWSPSGDDAVVYAVTANGATSWTVTATDASGYRLCRVYPGGAPCPAL